MAWEADIVLTTFGMLSTEWNAKYPITCSPLMQVHWQRVILDEGHLVGSLSVTNKLQMAVNLRARSRWIMTGTPTPAAGGSMQPDYLQPLLSFLKDEPFGSAIQTWKQAIGEPLAAKKPEGRWRILELLSRCMIRASKTDLRDFPKLKREVKLLNPSPQHALSYNHFVDLIRHNLLTSDWYDPNHRESLLNAANHKRAIQTLNNLRLSCCVTGNITLTVSLDDRIEVLQMLADIHGWDQPWARPNEYNLLVDQDHPGAVFDEAMKHGGVCQRCSTFHRVLIFSPCAHLLCVECASQSRTSCTHCHTPYVMQDTDHPERAIENPKPQWAVPQQLIELQPGYVQLGATGQGEGTWQESWMETLETTKCDYLLSRLHELGAIRPKGGSGSSVSYATTTVGILQHHQPPKVIVYSQFWNHSCLLENCFTQHGVSFALYRKQMLQKEKNRDLRRFITSTGYDCNVLLMDESGALGLDLSMVSHIFLMEPMDNSSLENQVVSRAWRMGAKKMVTVETLVMIGTPEELLMQRHNEVEEEVEVLPGERKAAELAARNEFFTALKPI